MADTKLSELPHITDVQGTDEVYVADDPAGTPASKAATVAELLKAVNTLAASSGLTLQDRALVIDDPTGVPTAQYATWQQVWELLNVLAGLGAAPATADKLALYDTSGAAIVSITVQELYDAINNLGALAAPAGVANRVPLHTGASSKYATVQELLEAVTNLTGLAAAPAEDDELLVYDASAAAGRKVLVRELLDAQRAFGGIYVSGGTGSQTLSADVWAKVTQFTTNQGVALNVTEDQLNDKITVTDPGIYRVSFTAAITGATDRAHELAVYWNAARQEHIKTRIQLQGTDPATHHASGLVDVTTGSTDFELWAKSIAAGDGSFSLVHGNLTVERVGDT